MLKVIFPIRGILTFPLDLKVREITASLQKNVSQIRDIINSLRPQRFCPSVTSNIQSEELG